MPAAFLLTLTVLQLDVVRDALSTCGHHGCGHFDGAQEWWGCGPHGQYGTTVKERLGKVSTLVQKVDPRAITMAPERARIAWDLAASIRLAQAARRLKKPVDLASMPRASSTPPARVDCLQSGTRSFMAPLDSLKEPPRPPQRRRPEQPAVPALFPVPLDSPKSKKKPRATPKKKKKAKQS